MELREYKLCKARDHHNYRVLQKCMTSWKLFFYNFQYARLQLFVMFSVRRFHQKFERWKGYTNIGRCLKFLDSKRNIILKKYSFLCVKISSKYRGNKISIQSHALKLWQKYTNRCKYIYKMWAWLLFSFRRKRSITIIQRAFRKFNWRRKHRFAVKINRFVFKKHSYLLYFRRRDAEKIRREREEFVVQCYINTMTAVLAEYFDSVEGSMAVDGLCRDDKDSKEGQSKRPLFPAASEFNDGSILLSTAQKVKRLLRLRCEIELTKLLLWMCRENLLFPRKSRVEVTGLVFSKTEVLSLFSATHLFANTAQRRLAQPAIQPAVLSEVRRRAGSAYHSSYFMAKLQKAWEDERAGEKVEQQQAQEEQWSGAEKVAAYWCRQCFETFLLKRFYILHKPACIGNKGRFTVFAQRKGLFSRGGSSDVVNRQFFFSTKDSHETRLLVLEKKFQKYRCWERIQHLTRSIVSQACHRLCFECFP